MTLLSISDLTAMHDIVAPLVRDIVHCHPSAFCSDFDGTLSPIASTPSSASMLPEIQNLLPAIQSQFDCTAIISGRDLNSLWNLVKIPGIIYVGDHGNRFWEAPTDKVPQPPLSVLDNDLEIMLDSLLAHHANVMKDVVIERKNVTASLHYRSARNPDQTRQELLAVLEPLTQQTGVHIHEGKALLELVSPLAQNKGDALKKLAAAHHLQSIIYMGDDVTDIAGFRALHELRTTMGCHTLCVGIDHAEAPSNLSEATDIMLANIFLVPAFLAMLNLRV